MCAQILWPLWACADKGNPNPNQQMRNPDRLENSALREGIQPKTSFDVSHGAQTWWRTDTTNKHSPNPTDGQAPISLELFLDVNSDWGRFSMRIEFLQNSVQILRKFTVFMRTESPTKSSTNSTQVYTTVDFQSPSSATDSEFKSETVTPNKHRI